MPRSPHISSIALRLLMSLIGVSVGMCAYASQPTIKEVESSRLRLRKKLNIPAEKSLFDYLHSIYN